MEFKTKAKMRFGAVLLIAAGLAILVPLALAQDYSFNLQENDNW